MPLILTEVAQRRGHIWKGWYMSCRAEIGAGVKRKSHWWISPPLPPLTPDTALCPAEKLAIPAGLLVSLAVSSLSAA